MVASALTRRSTHQPPLGTASESHVVTAGGRRIPAESLERLERLDDTVFAALSGDAGALDKAAAEWRAAAETLDPGLLNETRAHYLKRAESRFKCSQESAEEKLTVGFAALEILGLLGD